VSHCGVERRQIVDEEVQLHIAQVVEPQAFGNAS
jgi:hypothetical protein